MGGSGLSFQVCWWVGALVFLVVFCGLRVVWVFVVVRGLLFGFVFGVWFLFRHGMQFLTSLGLPFCVYLVLFIVG